MDFPQAKERFRAAERMLENRGYLSAEGEAILNICAGLVELTAALSYGLKQLHQDIESIKQEGGGGAA